VAASMGCSKRQGEGTPHYVHMHIHIGCRRGQPRWVVGRGKGRCFQGARTRCARDARMQLTLAQPQQQLHSWLQSEQLQAVVCRSTVGKKNSPVCSPVWGQSGQT